MKWKWNLLFVARIIVLVALMGSAFFCLWKGYFATPFDMKWATEMTSLCGLTFIYCFIHRKSEMVMFLYGAKAAVMLPLVSGLFYHWMTRPEFKQTPVWLVGLLLSIALAILQLMDTIWMSKGKLYLPLSIVSGVICLALIGIGATGVYALCLLGVFFLIVAISDFFVKRYLQNGGKENE